MKNSHLMRQVIEGFFAIREISATRRIGLVAPQTIASVARAYPVGRLTYVTGDLSKLSLSACPGSIDVAYSQGFIHYLRFSSAVDLLNKINRRMKKGGHLFLSAAGFDTVLAQHHPDRNKPVDERYSAIDSDADREHAGTAPLCIYRLDDLQFVTHLAGFTTIDCWLTEFGNVQAVFSKL